MNPFRYEIGQTVFVREDLCAEYHVKPNTALTVHSLTKNSRGTFATCMTQGRRICIDERGLVFTNKRPNVAINTDPVPA